MIKKLFLYVCAVLVAFSLCSCAARGTADDASVTSGVADADVKDVVVEPDATLDNDGVKYDVKSDGDTHVSYDRETYTTVIIDGEYYHRVTWTCDKHENCDYVYTKDHRCLTQRPDCQGGCFNHH